MIIQMDLFRQLPLIIEKRSKQRGESYYELQREGVDYLREISNRKLRIILNVTSEIDIGPFCDNFMGQSPTKSNIKELVGKDILSMLSIYSLKEQLKDGRALLLINARVFEKASNSDYLLLGYLMSSLIIYHQNEQLDLKKKGTGQQKVVIELSRLSEKLHNTDISELNAQIRFDKKPFFLYLMYGVKGDQNSAKELFSQFFKGMNRQDQEDYKKATEALIDYFPNRTSFYLQSPFEREQIQKIRASFIQKIAGRKMFNFEVTGKSVQMLCLEMCEHFNNPNHDTLDMKSLYTRVVQQQKQRVLTEGIRMYIQSLSHSLNNNIFPVQVDELCNIRDQVNLETAEFIRQMAVNCMNLSEYLSARDEINKRTAQRWGDAVHQNLKASRDLNSNLVNEFSKNDWNEDSQVDTMCEELIQKVHLFAYKSIGSTAKSSMAELTQALVQDLCSKVSEKLKSKNQILEFLQTQNLQYREKMTQLEESLQKCQNRLQMHFDRMGSSIRQGIYETDEEWEQHIKEVKALEEKIRILEHHYELKILELDEVYDQFERFTSSVDQSKVKKSVMVLGNELTSSVRDFLKGINELEQFKKTFFKQFERKRDDWYNQSQKYSKANDELRNRVASSQKAIEQLILNLKRCHQTINIYASITGKSKQEIDNQIQEQTLMKVKLAEQQSKILIYEKSFQLIAQHIKQGRKQPLVNFAKISSDSNLKKLLLRIVE